jgi:hypothetical protein
MMEETPPQKKKMMEETIRPFSKEKTIRPMKLH